MIPAEPSPSVENVGRPMREKLAGFAHTLRDNGFKIGLAETRDALAILTHSLASRSTSLRSAFRSLFCATHSDWDRFDEIFDAYWFGGHMRQDRPSAAILTHNGEIVLAGRLRMLDPTAASPPGAGRVGLKSLL
jgi:uncharacterized protein with von Willebrand factor type A (vWA) domain